MIARYAIIVPLAWACGFATYYAALRLIWDQGFGGDAAAVAFWSLMALVVAVPLAYIPVLHQVRRVTGAYRPLWPFPLAAILLGVVPTGLILLRFGVGLRALGSPEAVLFYLMFSVVGSIIGTGYAWPRRRARGAIADGEP